MPTTELSGENFTDGKIGIIDLLCLSGLAPSRGEARRLIIQGGVLADEEKVGSIDVSFGEDSFKDGLVIKKGKKTYHRFIIG